MAELMFPMVISIVITVILLVGLLLSAFFLDFIKDAWKIPFAAAIDVLDFIAMFSPGLLGGYMDLAVAVGGIAIFILLGRSVLKYPSAVAVGVEGYINIGTPVVMPFIGQVTGLLPINTILMIVDAIID